MRVLPKSLLIAALVALAFGIARCDGGMNISIDLTPRRDLGTERAELGLIGSDELDLSGTSLPTPIIDAIAPSAVPNFVDAPITIYGQHFQPGAIVAVNSKPCVSTSVVSSGVINCVVPAAPRICGPAVITVTNSDHQSGVDTQHFFYGPATIKFGAPVQSAAKPSLALHALSVDVNADGRLDLIVPGGANGAYPLYLYLGKGNGTFLSGVPFGTTVQDAAFGDMNGDGAPDIVMADSAQSHLSLLLGQGNGTFVASPVASSDPAPIAVTVGDFDGDRDLDIGYATAAANASVLYNAGNGTFGSSQTLFSFSSIPRWVQFADMNRDGRPDVVYGLDVLTSLNLLGIILDKGASGREAKTITYNANTSLLLAKDVNGDQIVDAVFTAGGKVGEMLNDGAANLSARQDLTVGSFIIRSTAVEDLNNDGLMDIVTNNGSFFSYLQSKGGGAYASALNVFGAVLGDPIAVADFDGDSLKDVAILGYSGSQIVIQVFPQTCN